ncbi:MAG: VanZ family protein [Candidatus Gastranaerophilales bacterium]|nr:VanZ family protein [Candidatus Gastranaerophilales bacterium]
MVAYLIKWILLLLIMAPFYLWIRHPLRHIKSGNQKDIRIETAREIALGLFLLFMASLLALVFQGTYRSPVGMFQSAQDRIRQGIGINLTPFRTIGIYFERHMGLDHFLVNILGNIVMFAPWGLGLPLLWKQNQKVWRVLLYAALLPLLIETVQLFIGRSVDVDDFLLNFLGGCLGGLLYVILRKWNPKLAVLAR